MLPRGGRCAFQSDRDHACHRQISGMSERNLPFGDPQLRRQGGRLAPQPNRGRPEVVANHIHVGPGDSLAEPSSKGFEDRFLGGESCGVTLCPNSRRGFRVCLFAAGKTTVEEGLSVLLPHPFDADDLYEVDAMSNDVHKVASHATVIRTVLHVNQPRTDQPNTGTRPL